jgi:hypothetical protein
MTALHLRQHVTWHRTLPGSRYIQHLAAVVVEIGATRVCIAVLLLGVRVQRWVRAGSLRSRR